MRNLLFRVAAGGALAGGVLAVHRWRTSRHAGGVPFNGMRIAMNTAINPWLLRRGFAGGRHSELGMLEHVGRVSGKVHRTPVHPTAIGDLVWIPRPYGEKSQWARNVIAAGRCRLQLHGEILELDEPEIVPASDDPALSDAAADLARWLGISYLQLHRVPAEAMPIAS
jgi:deazaflavin-dependent oxidoreductase (nitroreductase family)